jgi:Na+/H+ antiporter NhaC
MKNNIISIILGFIVAVFGYFIFGFNIKYKGPNSNDVRNKIYRVDEKCYMLEPIVHICR